MTQRPAPQASAPRSYPEWRGYSLFHWVLCVAALVFALLWILTFIAAGFSIPAWVPAAAVISIALAMWVP
jgi:hypothetical protein